MRNGWLLLITAGILLSCSAAGFCQAPPFPDFPLPPLPGLGGGLLPSLLDPFGLLGGGQGNNQNNQVYSPALCLRNPYEPGTSIHQFWQARMNWAEQNPVKAWWLPRRPDGTVIFEGESDYITDAMGLNVPLSIILKTNQMNPGPVNSLDRLQHLHLPADSARDGAEYNNKRPLPLNRMDQRYGITW